MSSLAEFLDALFVRFRDRPMIGLNAPERTTWLTYGDVQQRIHGAAGRLQEMGVEPGDRVAIWAPSGPAYALSLLAMWRSGVVAVPLDLNSRPEFAATVIGLTRAKVLVAGPAQRANAPESVTVVDTDELVGPGGPAMAPVELTSSSLADIVFTSGTTGTPKGVTLSHGNILASVTAASGMVQPEPRFRLLSALPLSHMFEQSIGLLTPISGGGSVVYLTALQPSNIFRAFERDGITTMLVVPQVLKLFLNAIEREVDRQGKRRAFETLLKLAAWTPMNLRRLLFPAVHKRFGGTLEFFLCGGAHLDPELQRRWELLGVRVIQGYGSTECSPLVTGNNMERRTLGSVGRAAPGVEVKIAPDGEIIARGANIMVGYWENPAATASALEDGWYHTGDVGRIDEHGELHLMGRKKSMIVLANGLNVFPEDIEEALKADERVTDALVVGVQGDDGQTVHAALLLKEASQAADVVKTANRQLAAPQQIRAFTVWPDPDFPRTHTMKIRRNVVEETVRSQQAGAKR